MSKSTCLRYSHKTVIVKGDTNQNYLNFINSLHFQTVSRLIQLLGNQILGQYKQKGPPPHVRGSSSGNHCLVDLSVMWVIILLLLCMHQSDKMRV